MAIENTRRVQSHRPIDENWEEAMLVSEGLDWRARISLTSKLVLDQNRLISKLRVTTLSN